MTMARDEFHLRCPDAQVPEIVRPGRLRIDHGAGRLLIGRREQCHDFDVDIEYRPDDDNERVFTRQVLHQQVPGTEDLLGRLR